MEAKDLPSKSALIGELQSDNEHTELHDNRQLWASKDL